MTDPTRNRTHPTRSVRAPILVLLALLMLVATGTALAVQASNTQTSGKKVSASTIDELHARIADHELITLRITRNVTYSASLLFDPNMMTYYATLADGDNYLRAIKTNKDADAESVYRTFATQSRQLAQVKIDTIRLKAGKQYTQYLLSVNQQRLKALRSDIKQQRGQEQKVAQAQKQAHEQATALASDVRASSSQLTALQRKIQSLESQQSELKLNIPKADSSAHGTAKSNAGSTASTSPR
jgi:uncharacterized protein YaaQ